MSARARLVAAFTVLLFATELLALPCGTACHRSEADQDSTQAAASSSEHSCHQAPVPEDGPQIAGVPSPCAHQHDAPDVPCTSAPNDHGHQTALMPAFVPLPAPEDVMASAALLSSPPDSISLARLLRSLRI